MSVGALTDPVVGDLGIVAFWEASLDSDVHSLVAVCLDGHEVASVGDLCRLGGVDLLQEAGGAVPWSLPAGDIPVDGTSSFGKVVESPL